MGRNKKNTTGTAGGHLPTLQIGSRVRCSDDGVTGRLVWANAVSEKIQWDDGEQVTWKRDTLATRPLEILDADGAGQTTEPAATDAAEGIAAATNAEQPAAPADTAAIEPTATTEQSQAEPETLPAEPAVTEPATTFTEQPVIEPAATPESPVEQSTPSS